MAIRFQQVLPADPITEALVVETAEVFYIHSGDAYECSVSLTVAAGATAYVLFVIGSSEKHVHLRDYAIEATAAPVVVIFSEAPTVTDNGSATSSINLHRDSTNTSIGTLYTGTTVSNTGTQLVKTLLTGTKQDGGFGRGSAPKEILLTSNEDYLWSFTNNAVGSSDIVFRPFWVEK